MRYVRNGVRLVRRIPPLVDRFRGYGAPLADFLDRPCRNTIWPWSSTSGALLIGSRVGTRARATRCSICTTSSRHGIRRGQSAERGRKRWRIGFFARAALRPRAPVAAALLAAARDFAR